MFLAYVTLLQIGNIENRSKNNKRTILYGGKKVSVVDALVSRFATEIKKASMKLFTLDNILLLSLCFKWQLF